VSAPLGGKVAVITGAGSGLGEATARALAAAGAAVACLDIRADAAETTARELAGYGATALGAQCDVSDARAIGDAVDRAMRDLGGLDIVVNAAGVDHTVSVEDMTVAQWDQVIGVNLRGPFLMAKAAWPTMKAQGGGHIVNVASTGALRMWANASAYHASKAGLVALGRGLGVEGRPYGIRVTTIFPGGMRTHFFDRFAEQGIPMPDADKLQEPAAVAEVIRFVVCAPPESVIQELLVTPLLETSWP
jgi:NAD(P)-dependent dehydrogenase (short-subunit alcohol dehydrogenase family)